MPSETLNDFMPIVFHRLGITMIFIGLSVAVLMLSQVLLLTRRPEASPSKEIEVHRNLSLVVAVAAGAVALGFLYVAYQGLTLLNL